MLSIPLPGFESSKLVPNTKAKTAALIALAYILTACSDEPTPSRVTGLELPEKSLSTAPALEENSGEEAFV